MISVIVYINDRPIYMRNALNITHDHGTKIDESLDKYKCDDGTMLAHNRDDGAVKLAIKMLETIEEMKHEQG